MSYLIQSLRKKPIIGSNIDLLPYDETYINEIIKLRNQSRAKYFLQQSYDITIEQQKQWIQNYLAKDNEIGFIIKDKKGQMIGIMFLYNYTGSSVEIGRVTFDLSKIMGKPYTIEAATIIFDLAFDYLKVQEVIAIVKDDNPLITFNTKIGFVSGGSQIIRGKCYTEMKLLATNRRYLNFQNYIGAWKAKTESRVCK